MLDELISKNIKFCKAVKQYDPPLDDYTAAVLTTMTIGVRKAQKENRALERKIQREEARQLKAAKTELAQGGFTLVELLVVVTIMVLLLAISVPMFQPLLKSQQTHNAAQVLASTFQLARAQAMREGRAVGVKLIPFDTAPTTAIQLRICRETAPVINAEEQRVRVDNGTIQLMKYDTGTDAWIDDTATLPSAFRAGAMIQFNRQGRFYELETSTTLKAPYNQLTFPAAEYLIRPQAAPALSPPVIMPKATIVDLHFSGGSGTQFPPVFDKSAFTITGNPKAGITVVFSPLGAVQDVLFNDGYGNSEPANVGTRVLPNEMLYFCVGDWDRQTGTNGTSLADDGKSNVQVTSSYWVTLHPKTGAVRLTENKAVDGITDYDVISARQYATEHYFGVGGN
jgi:prepilin-type N-terminal cleavage/methylation domain-containing protein